MIVEQLWRYPVKSMGGERVTAADVNELGITGDRSFGIVDNESGYVLTARREPRLLFATAALAGANVVVSLPDGTQTDRSDAIAAWLERDVRLQRAGAHGGTFENPLDVEHETGWVAWQGPPGAWHDSARSRVSLVSTATVGEWDVRRFRPNIVLRGVGDDALVGHAVALGSARLDVKKQIDRCIMVTRPQPGLDRDLDVLKTIRRERATFLAVGALVAQPGRLRVGDRLRDLGAAR